MNIRTPRMMMELRARAIAAECPLTWTQARDLAYFAGLEDGRAEFEMWLLWSGSIGEVAEWLWEFWVERGDDLHENDWAPVPAGISAGPVSPAPSGGRPGFARDANQRQPRGLYSPVSCR